MGSQCEQHHHHLKMSRKQLKLEMWSCCQWRSPHVKRSRVGGCIPAIWTQEGKRFLIFYMSLSWMLELLATNEDKITSRCF